MKAQRPQQESNRTYDRRTCFRSSDSTYLAEHSNHSYSRSSPSHSHLPNPNPIFPYLIFCITLIIPRAATSSSPSYKHVCLFVTPVKKKERLSGEAAGYNPRRSIHVWKNRTPFHAGKLRCKKTKKRTNHEFVQMKHGDKTEVVGLSS